VMPTCASAACASFALIAVERRTAIGNNQCAIEAAVPSDHCATGTRKMVMLSTSGGGSITR